MIRLTSLSRGFPRVGSPRAISMLAGDDGTLPGMGFRKTPGPYERPWPARIGRYVVLGRIAGGGMGSVLAGQMRGAAGFSRLVAIKCLQTRWLDDLKYVERFTTEVKLSTLIRHPNVVQALDVVEDQGELFLVMDYVDGVTLAALLADLNQCERRLPVQLALGIMAAALRGLHAAHQATDESGAPCHIVHRDVSPQNIMLSRQGQVVVLDFGAAKSAGHSQQTAAGVLVGKLAYVAPEQVRGERSSPRTDVFSAGVVLWEALVGRRLFHDPERTRGELLRTLVLEPVERPSQLRPDVPRPVDDVVRRALERNPERRFQTALEFAEALAAAGAGDTGEALGELIGEVCAARLSEKAALLRSGLERAAARASAEASTPSFAPAAPARVSWAERALAPLAWRRSPLAWLGATALTAAVAWGVVKTRHAQGWGDTPARPLTRSILRSMPDTAPRAGDEPRPVSLASSSAPLAIASAGAPEAAVGDLESGGGSSPAPREPAAGHGRPRRGPAASAAARAKPVVRRAPVPDCEPPTYMDSAGIRHFKKDCL